MDGNNKPAIHLPNRFTITFRAGALLAIANIICAVAIAFAYIRVHTVQKCISVVGYAQKDITSDLIIWSAMVQGNDPDRIKAYEQVQTGMKAALAYLRSHNIPEDQIQVSSISSTANFKRDKNNNPTDQLIGWTLTQGITVTSRDVQKVTDVSQGITDLIESGVQIDSGDPEYIYTRLPDLKIVMLASATADAHTRAVQIAANSGAALGRLLDAKMGVMQVNPIYSTDVSEEGNNDTSSYQKTIMAVIHADFSLQ